MGAFYMNEAMFDLPEAEFVDRTVTYLVGKSPAGNGVVLLVERRPYPGEKPLRQHATEHGIEAATRLRGYKVLFEREIEVAGQPAIDVGARWRADDGEPIYTRRTHLTMGPTWFIIAGEGPATDREFCDAYVDHVLTTIRLRE